MGLSSSEIQTDLEFQLLTDADGIYGFGFRSKSHQQNENMLEVAPDIILRADLIKPLTHSEHANFVFLPLYNTNLSEWIGNKMYLESIFTHIQTAMIAQRNCVPDNCLSFLFDGTEPEAWEPFPDEYETYSKEAIAQVEKVISSAYASCVPPDVMPVLAQLPINWRYRAYTHMAGSQRFTQLLSVFPVLAFKLMSEAASADLPDGTRERAKEMVEEGQKLGKIADVMKVATAMQRISIQDADDSFPMMGHFCNYNSHLQNYWDRNAENIGRWVWNINLAHGTGHEFAVWMVCNQHECSSKFDVLKIGDWVRASLEGTSISPVTRAFEKTMSARTVERLSEEWHNNMEGAYNAILGIKRPDYWTGCPEADGCETEEKYTKVIREKIAAKILPKAWVGDAEINGIKCRFVSWSRI